MADEKKQEEAGKVKRPTALKRDIQSEKRRLLNRSFKAATKTAERSLLEAIEKKEKAAALKKFHAFQSIVDKGAKKGILKRNHVSRVKASFAKKVASI